MVSSLLYLVEMRQLMSFIYVSHETWFKLVACGLEKSLWWVLCVWYIWCIYFHKDHACFKLKMYGVMLSIYSYVTYHVICIMIFIVTHTCTPWMQWFRGSLLCVLVCANRHLRSFVNSNHIAHIKGEPFINHWTQNSNCLYHFVSFNRVVINH